MEDIQVMENDGRDGERRTAFRALTRFNLKVGVPGLAMYEVCETTSLQLQKNFRAISL